MSPIKSPIKYRSWAVHLLCLIVLASCGPESRPYPSENINDGPYVFHRLNLTESFLLCNGIVNRVTIFQRDELSFPSDCLNFSGRITLKPTLFATEVASFQDVPQIAALSDIHGQFDIFVKLLKAHNIINDSHKWSWANGHLVIVGDVFDRGAQVTETLWFIYALEEQAKSVGGQVHYLLGNHEIMVLQNDLRYLHEKYEAVSKVLGLNYSELFGYGTELGRWLRTKPVAIKINDLAFAHGGFHPEFKLHFRNLEALNSAIRQSIDTSRKTIKQSRKLSFLYGKNGPLWYRGYFQDKKMSKEQVSKVLRDLEVSHIVVGHTTHSQIKSYFEGAVIAIDSGIKKAKSGELLILKNGKMFRGLLNGQTLAL